MDQSQHARDDPSPNMGSSLPRHGIQQVLSCTHCRQRKIKCEKIHPCSQCQRSGLPCVFPERVRPFKKKRSTSKATTDELIARLGRMEELIERMKDEGKDVNGNKSTEDQQSTSPAVSQDKSPTPENAKSPESVTSDGAGGGANRYIASSFFNSLTNEFEGLRQTIDDDSEDEDEVSPVASRSPGDTHTSHSAVLFGSNQIPPKDLHMFYPSAHHMNLMCNIYAENVDPMFKVLHIPSLRKLVANAGAYAQNIPKGNYVEALLFAVYYAAIASLTPAECLTCFGDSQDSLLAKYRSCTEAALLNADLVNTTELGTIQALVIFLMSVRSHDDTQFVWTLTSVAVRLGHSIGLHREGSKPGLSPFATEQRRRLWWQIISLDIRNCEDRGSDPFILLESFNTRPPLCINDSDMDPESATLLTGRHEFTEMTKSSISFLVYPAAMHVAYVRPPRDSEDNSKDNFSFAEKECVLDEIEKRLEREVLIHCDPSNSLHWATSVISRLVMCRLRLALYQPPLHDQSHKARSHVSRETVLQNTVQLLEYCYLLETEPAVAKWGWFFRTHVQWHAMAATLALLCVASRSSPLVERAWRIVDNLFEIFAAAIADSKSGMLWRPIKKLMTKAQAKREEIAAEAKNSGAQAQRPLPQFETFTYLQDPSCMIKSINLDVAPGANQAVIPNGSSSVDEAITADVLASVNFEETADSIDWGQWDQYMQDFEMEGQSEAMDAKPMQQEVQLGSWW